jgi:radical SAM superfamily enzyme YgiQ (UPF0313 family)
MRVCLATVHHTPAFTPLALLYLKAYLVEHEGFAFDDVRVLEFDADAEPADIARAIAAAEPQVVGLSCYLWNVKTLGAAAAILKTTRPETTIVAGGPEVGPVAADVLRRSPGFDAIVNSEGEIPFAEICRGNLDRVRGIVLRRGGDIVDTGEAAILQDLNELPSPHDERYTGDHESRTICIETQRGCVFRCNFCYYNKDFSIRNRRFPLDRVTREIGYWLERDVSWIYLMDPIFNLNAERAKAICRFIIDHNRRRTRFHAEVWAEFFDDELARLMREANFQFLEVGLQSIDDTALATVERRLRMQRFVAGVEHLKRHRLPFELQLIYGLPGDTVASFRKSLNFAVSLGPPELAVFTLMVLPGTELWRKADVLKLEFDREPPYDVRSHYSMSEADIDYGRRVVEALKQIGNSRTLRLLAHQRGITFADIVDEWIAWRDEQAYPPPSMPTPKLFVADFCHRNRIPPEFYRSFASWEFRG